jgi:hypothetical protein
MQFAAATNAFGKTGIAPKEEKQSCCGQSVDLNE